MKVKQASNVGNNSSRVWEAICSKCSLTLSERQSELTRAGDNVYGMFANSECFICSTPVKFFPTDEYDN